MKIILVLNKTLQRGDGIKFDSGYYNLYIPLLEIGHEVYFYDTINPIEKDFNSDFMCLNDLQEYYDNLIDKNEE